ncbi:MAG: F390 synthetase-related protein [Saezia sp.]
MSRSNKFLQTAQTLWYYAQAKRLQKNVCHASRATLEAYQQKRLKIFTQKVLAKSPYFRAYTHLPVHQWPLMDKKLMMAEFDQMNTASLKRDELLACALQAEKTRDFAPLLKNFSVGLSSGTSGQRGIFVASAQERALWTGSILAKLLPRGLFHGEFHGERIALFLRADNELYQNVNNKWLSLAFFDLFSAFDEQCQKLQHYQPTIIVAPAQVLKALALRKERKELQIDPTLVISAAEVLTPQDKNYLQQVFQRVGEVYQATEGFLGATCAHGMLHLNEEYVHIEPQWLDDERFTPIITDFTRQTQPIVRYRLDDILVVERTPCPCGSSAMGIKHIEGRCDDQLILPKAHASSQETITIFADVCHRALAQALPLACDYQLTQSQGINSPLLTLSAETSLETLQACQKQLTSLLKQQGVALEALSWQLHETLPPSSFQHKRRRIMRTNNVGENA